ncbi:MAG TPA: FxSxx-COOH system tetratricopeptide repeat protein [Pilimelia sp.]|nr:FxSxx-COOH system tetratricopeptide repeat protein [Pilimelia sp.]
MADRQLSWDDKQRLCEALLQIRDLHDPETRNLYVSELETHLGQSLNVRRYADARHDLISLISACQGYRSGVRSFIDIVEGFQRGSVAIVRVRRLVEEMERAPLMSPADREALHGLIDGISTNTIRVAFHDIVEPADLQPQPNWHDVTSVVRRIEQASADAADPPLVLVFVDRLAHNVDSGRAADLHQWISRVGGALGMDPAALRTLCVETIGRLDDGRLPADVPGADVAQVVANMPERSASHQALLPDKSSTAGVAVISTSQTTHSPPDQSDVLRLWGDVPIRNPDFTGRDPLLHLLREALESKSKASVLPQTLHGLGGVGKTQLAVEYVYRNADRYDIVWWIPAEQVSLVLASLETLADRMGLPRSEDRKQTANTVLNSLAHTRSRWLLVYDNADQPEEIAQLVPSAGGHVILTSRDQSWANVWEAIEVDVFERHESVELVRKRGESITADDADRLAAKLGDLPLALDQAASWQAATGMPVSEYLQLFDEHVRELLSEGRPPTYHTTVAAFVSLAFDRLRTEASAVAQLLELFAFLGAEPISVGLLRRGREAHMTPALSQALRQPIHLNRTIRQLRRYGLAKVDPNQRIQVHRLVQMVLREGLTEQLREQIRANVHNLLASANPGDPDDPATWPVHAEIGPHVQAAGLIEADTIEARQVALDQIRYLWATGDYEGARRLGEIVVPAWREAEGDGLGPDGEQTLIATRHLSNALRSLGFNAEARKLAIQAYEGFRNNPAFGEEHEHTVITGVSLGVDLRLAGDFRAALESDRRILGGHIRVFGEDDQYTIRARNSLAVNLRMLGDFGEALQIDQELVEAWQRTVGENDSRTLFCIANVARDLYGLGRYAEALDLQSRTWPIFRDRLGLRHSYVLLAARTVAIALRKTGRYAEALSQARENYHDYDARFGPDHEHTLAAKMSYANSLRVANELGLARSEAADAVDRYVTSFGAGHPLTLSATANLAIIMRAMGDHDEARAKDEATLEAMTEVLGAEHGYTLCVANNFANDLARHESTAARELSQRTLDISRRVRGEDHPYTLACAVNAALDLREVDRAAGQALLDKTQRELARVLGPQHPETLDAIGARRAECDIEPPPT